MALFISLTNYAVVFYRICNDIPRPPRVYCTVASGVIPRVGKSSMSTRRIILESVPACQISPAHQGSVLSLFLQLMWLFSKLRDTVYNELALANYYPHRQLCCSLLLVLVTIGHQITASLTLLIILLTMRTFSLLALACILFQSVSALPTPGRNIEYRPPFD